MTCLAPEKTENTYHALPLCQIAAWQFPAMVKDDVTLLPCPILAGIPSLQRGAVWKPGQVELVWDSIFRGFPIGALVVSRCDKATKQETHSGRYGLGWPSHSITHYLLDGQQRCNAIALGYLDPLGQNAGYEPLAALWLDLVKPPEVQESTRHFWFRVLTKAHPWGYQCKDSAPPLGVEAIRSALREYFGEQKAYPRPSPIETWPPVDLRKDSMKTGLPTSAPIPLAWLLEASGAGCTGRGLWTDLQSRCATHLKPWADKVGMILKRYLDGEPNEQIRRIESGLEYAKQMRIIALDVEFTNIDADVHNGTIGASKLSDIEQLFQRLNTQGTRLEGAELAFSMIKAYWPGIEKTFAPSNLAVRPLDDARLAVLGVRAARINEQPTAGERRFPEPLSIHQIRALAQVADDGQHTAQVADRSRVLAYLGITVATTKCDFHLNLDLIDKWLLFDAANFADFGLPPVLRTEVARRAPEVFLLLLHLAQRARKQRDDLRDDITWKKSIIGLVTTLLWFGVDRPKAIDLIGNRLAETREINGYSLWGILDDRLKEKISGYLCYVFTPAELDKEIPKAPADDTLDQWTLYDVLKNGTDTARFTASVWPFIERIRGNRALLIYAQRAYICRQFPTYDPALPDTWEDHNRPWDFDHILPSATTYYKHLRFRKSCNEWMSTIGNLRAWPLELNRSKSAGTPNDSIAEVELVDSVIVDKSELDRFSMRSDDLSNPNESADFMNAARGRMVRIYGDGWYVPLDIARLFQAPPANVKGTITVSTSLTSP